MFRVNFDLRVDLAFGLLTNLKPHFLNKYFIFTFRDSEIIFNQADYFLQQLYKYDICVYEEPAVLALVALRMAEASLQNDLQFSQKPDSKNHSTDVSSIYSDPEDYDIACNESCEPPVVLRNNFQPLKLTGLSKRPPDTSPVIIDNYKRRATPVLASETEAAHKSIMAPFQIKKSSVLKKYDLSPCKLNLRVRRLHSDVIHTDFSRTGSEVTSKSNLDLKHWIDHFEPFGRQRILGLADECLESLKMNGLDELHKPP